MLPEPVLQLPKLPVLLWLMQPMLMSPVPDPVSGLLLPVSDLEPVNYTVTEGSTIITFKPEYLKSLSAGNHSFELVWTDGTAATNFTVAENADQSAKSPKTGEDFSMALCTVLLMVSCAGLAGMFVRRKKSSLR
jgi:hypothetical protein